MKKVFIYSSALALLITAGCKKDYLSTAPTDQIDNGSVFTTTQNADAALNGIYRYMFERTTATTTNVQNKPGVTGILLGMDFMGEDLGISSANWYTSTGEGNWVGGRTDNHALTQYYYRTFYRIIGNANYIIDNIGKAVGPDTEKSRIKAEAFTLRAYAYSYLVQLYGKRYDASAKPNTQLGVPLVLTSTDTRKPRATVEAVYSSIMSDLDSAITLNVASRTSKSHANVWVAKGLKARVALTMQDYPTAIQYSKEVIDGNQFPLMTEAAYLSGFNNAPNLSEFMWATMASTDQGDTFGSFFAQIAYNANTSFMRANPKRINSALYNQIAASDVRKKLWEPAPTATNFPLPSSTFSRQPYMSKKFSVKQVGDPSLGDVPLMRSAEMYLILAEAYAKSGQSGLAQDALFQLVSRRDPNAVMSTNAGAALENEIYFNRRIELWGEGFRFLDLKRLNQPLDRTVVPNYVSASVNNLMQVPAGDPKWEFFIPRSEMEANPALAGQQNP